MCIASRVYNFATALGTHTHTLTPTGTVSAPTFTGAAFDPHPAFTKVIFCEAN